MIEISRNIHFLYKEEGSLLNLLQRRRPLSFSISDGALEANYLK